MSSGKNFSAQFVIVDLTSATGDFLSFYGDHYGGIFEQVFAPMLAFDSAR